MWQSLALLLAFGGLGAVSIGCPYADGGHLAAQLDTTDPGTEFLAEHEVDNTRSYLTSDAGGPINDQRTLKAGVRGPALLEDFRFRQKIQHFDHERVC